MRGKLRWSRDATRKPSIRPVALHRRGPNARDWFAAALHHVLSRLIANTVTSAPKFLAASLAVTLAGLR